MTWPQRVRLKPPLPLNHICKVIRDKNWKHNKELLRHYVKSHVDSLLLHGQVKRKGKRHRGFATWKYAEVVHARCYAIIIINKVL